MSVWISIDTPPTEDGVYEYKFANGHLTELRFVGEDFLTAGGAAHRLMTGDTWRPAKKKLLPIMQLIWETSKRIRDHRNKYKVYAKAGEEMGELSQEIMIDEGDHYKEPGKDGVIGEAIDVIICMGDMIYQQDPEITEQEVLAIAERKLNKWIEKDNEKSNRTDGDV